MPCANCTMMGSTINLILILSYSITCGTINEFVVPKSNRQPPILSFILQFNFNKLEALLLWAPILVMKPLWKSIYLGQWSHLPEMT